MATRITDAISSFFFKGTVGANKASEPGQPSPLKRARNDAHQPAGEPMEADQALSSDPASPAPGANAGGNKSVSPASGTPSTAGSPSEAAAVPANRSGGATQQKDMAAADVEAEAEAAEDQKLQEAEAEQKGMHVDPPADETTEATPMDRDGPMHHQGHQEPITLMPSTQLPAAPAPLTESHHALEFLTGRCVGAWEWLHLLPAPHSKSSTSAPAAGNNNHSSVAASTATAAAVSDGWEPFRMPLRPSLCRGVDEVADALNALVADATSTSLLVMGGPGVGKTMMVERAIARACATHNRVEGDRTLGVVRLHGCVHCEERVAFSEIARQLCSEFNQAYTAKSSFDDNLMFLRSVLLGLHKSLKSVVFVLDGFERFARMRGKQQLLYNLFDVLQHSKVQAAVVGITCAQDVMESMEKRVKSRFSHRKIIVTGPLHFEVPAVQPPAPAAGPARRQGGGGKDADAQPTITFGDTPLGILRDTLTLPQPPVPAAGVASRSGSQQQQQASGSSARPGAASATSTSSSLSPQATPLTRLSSQFVAQHNQAITDALRDNQVKAALKGLFHGVLTPGDIVCVARLALDAWEEDLAQQQLQGSTAQSAPAPQLAPRHLLTAMRTHAGLDNLGPCIQDLTVLQLWLLAGMARLEQRKQAVYNFEMVWDECRSINSGRGVLQRMTKDAAWRAFEQLIATGLAFWVDAGAEGKGRAMRYVGVSLRLTPGSVEKGIAEHRQCPDEIRRFVKMEA